MVERVLTVSTVENAARRAIAAGVARCETGLRHWSADWAGRCQHPQRVELTGRPGAGWRYVRRWSKLEGGKRIFRAAYREASIPKDGLPMFLDMSVRCRRCENCLRCRKRCWQQRAMSELRSAERTWVGTLTFRPSAYYKATCVARAKASAGGVDFETLDRAGKFRALQDVTGQEVTKFLKRIRRYSEAKLRYLLVAEEIPDFRKDGTANQFAGYPHYHILIHEVADPATGIVTPVRHKMLRAQWPHGFVVFELARVEDHQSATYLCKYLAKSALSRVRASAQYGSAWAIVGCGLKTPNNVNPRPSGEENANQNSPPPEKEGGNIGGVVPTTNIGSPEDCSQVRSDGLSDCVSQQSIQQIGRDGLRARLSKPDVQGIISATLCILQNSGAGPPGNPADWSCGVRRAEGRAGRRWVEEPTGARGLAKPPRVRPSDS